MDGSLFWGPEEAITTLTSSATDHTHATQTPTPEQSPLPSPAHLSAAAILATLSESRPPTDQVEEEDDLDDGQPGGIALDIDDNDTMAMAETYTTTAPTSLSYLVDEAVHHASLIVDQHAAALDSLESLSMGPLPPPSSSGPTLHDFLMSHGSIYDLDFETNANPNEEYLNHLNRDRFLSITSFFRHFVSLKKEDAFNLVLTPPPDSITRGDLRGDECDMQGINWGLRKMTRASVREKRTAFECARLSPRLVAVRQGMVPTPDTENYFSFRRMNTAHQASVPHFQLRNLMTTTSRNDIFYADRDVVLRTDASGTPASTVMNLTKCMTEAGKFQITTLAARNDLLIAGGFEGEYALTNLSDTFGTPASVGRIQDRYRDSKSHITNHLHLFESRHNYSPQAVLCSNDDRLRILDCHTNTFTHSFLYPQAVNCSATSPDGRMRVVVGDFQKTLITNAETGQPFETLSTHIDDVFACDWADDGIHVATAAQDSTIVVWDARYWGRPLNVLYSELSIPRCLKFSPVGGGPRVLVSAEADDYVNIINAQTFESRQVFDFFGRTAGISMTPDGSSLFVANSEPHFGGIMEFERCGRSARRRGQKWGDDGDDGNAVVDWHHDDAMDHDRRVVCGRHERERRNMDLGNLVV